MSGAGLEKSSFFRLVGAIVAGILATVIIVAAAAFAYRAMFASTIYIAKKPSGPPAAIRTSYDSGQSNYVYSNSPPERMGDYMFLRLRAGWKNGKVGSYRWGSTVDYLFIDLKNGHSSWLWQPPFPVVLDEYRLGSGKGILVVLVDKDTNGDHALGGLDVKTLVVIRPEGPGVEKLVENISRVDSVTPVDKDKALLIYDKDGKTFSAVYNFDAHELGMNEEVPPISVP